MTTTMEKNIAVCGAEAIRSFYNRIASRRTEWITKNKYYYSERERHYKFLIPKDSSVLELGCETGYLIGRLETSRGVGVDVSNEMIKIAKAQYPHVEFACEDIEKFTIDQTFDFIIISGTLSTVHNIQDLLQRIRPMARPDTRIIIEYRNELWAPLFHWGVKIGAKMPDLIYNWLSIDDITNFLEISDYQIIRRNFYLLMPVYIPFLSAFVNKFVAKLPIVRRLCLSQMAVARIPCAPGNSSTLTASVVLTCRDEEGNVEALVERIPNLGAHTELVFVEGHSVDRTYEKIEEMIRRYPHKDIKLIKQKGIGKADAHRLGFDEAKGDFICILEADLTTPPEEIKLLWDTCTSGKGEYVTGSRFVYQMEKGAMSFLNMAGNRLFGIIFTLIMEQRFTDTLCGLKGLSRENYHKIKRQQDYFGDFDPFGDFELTFGAMKLGLKSVEIPVHYRPRVYGQSKAYGHSFVSFLKHAWLLMRMSFIAFKKFKLF